MKLKEKWGNRVWGEASIRDIIAMKLDECDGGAIKVLDARTKVLADIVAALLERSQLSDEQILETVGLGSWEPATQAEVDV
jgi:hypothetical protein